MTPSRHVVAHDDAPSSVIEPAVFASLAIVPLPSSSRYKKCVSPSTASCRDGTNNFVYRCPAENRTCATVDVASVG